MRSQWLRLLTRNSTKGERRVGELLKQNRIKFKTKVRIGKYEADFVIGRVILEVDGSVHDHTNLAKDTYYFSLGYIPIHVSGKPLEKEILYLIKTNNYGR